MSDGLDNKFRTWPSPQPNLLTTGRLQLSPLGPLDDGNEGDFERRASPKLSAGVGGGFLQGASRQRGTTGSDLKLADTFDYWLGSLDFCFKWAGLSVLGEAMARFAEHSRHTGKVSGADVKEYSRSAAGLILQGGYMVGPRVELVARAAELIPFADTDPSLKRVHEVSGGMNYFLTNLRTKLQADYAYTAGDKLTKGSHQARLQLVYGF